MKALSNLLILVLSTTLLFSCVSGSDSADEEIAQNDTYIFQNIEYYFDQDDYIRTEEIPQENVLIINNTNKSFTWVTQPYVNATDYSEFKGAKNYLSLLNTDKKLEVPVPSAKAIAARSGEVDTNNTRKFRLFEEVSVPSEYSDMNERYNVAPYSQLVMKGKECIEKFSVTYEATFIGKNTGKTMVVKGKWEASINVGWKDQQIVASSTR